MDGFLCKTKRFTKSLWWIDNHCRQPFDIREKLVDRRFCQAEDRRFLETGKTETELPRQGLMRKRPPGWKGILKERQFTNSLLYFWRLPHGGEVVSVYTGGRNVYTLRKYESQYGIEEVLYCYPIPFDKKKKTRCRCVQKKKPQRIFAPRLLYEALPFAMTFPSTTKKSHVIAWLQPN